MQSAVPVRSGSPPSSHQPDVLCPLWPRLFSSLQDTLHPALQNRVKFAECFSDLLRNESHPNSVTGNCHHWVTGYSLWIGQAPLSSSAAA